MAILQNGKGIVSVVSFVSNVGTGASEVTVTLPSAVDGDLFVVMAVGQSSASCQINISDTTGWTVHEQTTGTSYASLMATSMKHSGSAAFQSVSFSAGSKWLWIGVYLLRSTYGSLTLTDSATNGGTSSASTDQITLTSGTVKRAGVALLAHMNDSKQTGYSLWRVKTSGGGDAMTEDLESWQGSGGPSNWSSAGFASLANPPLLTTSSDILEVAHDDTGNNFAMVGGFFESVAPSHEITAFRIRNDDGSETTATWDNVLNAGSKGFTYADDPKFRVRFRMYAGDTGGVPPEEGSWSDVGYVVLARCFSGGPLGNTWYLLDTATSISQPYLTSSATVTDGTITTQQLGTGTWNNGWFSDDNDLTIFEGGILTWGLTEYTELEFCLKLPARASAGYLGTFGWEFRVGYNDGTNIHVIPLSAALTGGGANPALVGRSPYIIQDGCQGVGSWGEYTLTVWDENAGSYHYVIGFVFNNNKTVTPPSGWTLLHESYYNDHKFVAYGRLIQSGDTTFTWSWTGTEDVLWFFTAHGGAGGITTYNSTTNTGTSITTTGDSNGSAPTVVTTWACAYNTSAISFSNGTNIDYTNRNEWSAYNMGGFVGTTYEASDVSQSYIVTSDTSDALQSLTWSVKPYSAFTLFYQAVAATSTVTAALAKKHIWARAIAATSTVTAAISKKLSLFKTIAATSTVGAVLSKKLSLFKTLAVTSTVSAAIKRMITKPIAATSTMTAAMTRVKGFLKTLAVTSTVSPVLSRTASFFRTLPVTPTFTPVIDQWRSFFRALPTTSTVTAAVSKKLSAFRTLAVASTLTPVLARVKKYWRTLAAASSITPGVSRVLTAFRTLASTSTLAPVLSKTSSFFRTLAVTSTMTPVLLKKLWMTIAATTTATADLIANKLGGTLFFQTVAATSTMTAALVRKAIYPVTIAATSAMSAVLARVAQYKRTLAATSTATAALTKKLFYTIAASTTMTAVIAQFRSFFRTLAASSTVSPVIAQFRQFYRALDVTSTLTPVISQFRSFFRSLDVSTTLTPAIGWKAFYYVTLAVNSTITAGLAAVKFFQLTLAALSTVTAGIATVYRKVQLVSLASTIVAALARVFIPGPGVPFLRHFQQSVGRRGRMMRTPDQDED